MQKGPFPAEIGILRAVWSSFIISLVTGWGRITNDLDTFTEDFTNNKAGSQALREVEVPIKSTEFCENVPEFGFNDLKFDKRFCAGGVEGNEY